MKKTRKGKGRKKKIIIFAVIIAIAVLGIVLISANSKKNKSAENKDVEVRKRDITATITGTAVIEPKESYSVMSLANGEILEADFEEGDRVEADTVLYKLDSKEIDSSIKSAEIAVEKAEQAYNDAVKAKEKTSITNDNNLERAELAVEKAEQGYDDAVNAKEKNSTANDNNLKRAEVAINQAEQGYNDAVDLKEQTDIGNQQTLTGAELSLEIAQSAYKNAEEAVEKLSVKSDIAGTVAEIYVKEGDYVLVGTSIARVFDNSSLELNVPFNENDAERIYPGERADVMVSGNGEVLFGVVTEVGNASVAKDGYMKVRNVKVRVDSPGALSPKDTATVNVGDIYCNDGANFEYINDKTIYAEVDGTIDTIKISAGNKVLAGDVIAEIENESIIDQKEQAALAVEEAELGEERAQSGIENSTGDSQIKNAEFAVKDANLVYDQAVENLDDYTMDSQIKNAELAVKDANLGYDQAVENLDDYTTDSQIKNAELAWEDALVNLEKLKDKRDDYEILAPISGQIITKNVKVGDKVDMTTMQQPMAVIYDMSELKLKIMVDELDINKIFLGQSVTISADALDGQEYEGEIYNISIDANNINGVTSYPVTVAIKEFDEKLLPGMNVDVEIEIATAKDVLSIPKDAVTRDNVVYVRGKKTDKDDKAPKGYRSVTVTLGINDSEYVEVKSGLKAGDKIKPGEKKQSMFPFGMMGGPMGGGASDSAASSGGGGAK